MKTTSRVTTATLLTAGMVLAGTGVSAVAHAAPTDPDYICDAIFRTTLPQFPAFVHATNCKAQHGAPYSSFRNRVIAEREPPQVHIFCGHGQVTQGGYFMADDDACHLVSYTKPR